VNYARGLGLEINVGKTVGMKVSRSGRQARTERLRVAGEYIPFVNRFEYLGLIVPANGRSYSHHVKNRVSKAIKALSGIRDPSELSISTAVKLFDIKVAPIVTYGIEVAWEFLSVKDLECIEKVKAAYLKRVLKVHKTSRNRLVYTLLGEVPFVQSFKERRGLADTRAWTLFRAQWESKCGEIDPMFYNVPAMRNHGWKEAGVDDRHVWTRVAIHGFHHKLCLRRTFHEPSVDCTCRLCGQKCERYHILNCMCRPSLFAVAKS